MSRKSAAIAIIYCCALHLSFAQSYNLDSLQLIWNSNALKEMIFDEHIEIQRRLPNIDKELSIAFGKALEKREDFMAVNSLKAKAYFELIFNPNLK
ncbi:hypothetical protein [Arcticibacterium luteifluviistationis]|uniref:Uncharacterized protein n=1 Tax=Arcticibacterium luteifluviistationis TaxID=1784714 RepID=A0A2Z4GEF0_9BACT|nr:hypothetical protein [Arcticibacterium luteifluviistationis]AWV99626.1 hypothetical protein DJ013_16180 [Arcticibacterium luteifluviistationis]